MIRALGFIMGSLGLFAALAGCAKNESQVVPSREVIASANVSESFAILKEKRTGKPVIAIHRSALEKEFLLQGNSATQHQIAWSSSIKSRIVAFRERDGRLVMLEATQGHTVTNTFPQNLVLAVFPTVEVRETASEWIPFDFNSGMTHYPVDADWFTSDRGSSYGPNNSTIPLTTSYLEQAKLAGNRLILRQIGQTSVEDEQSTVELKYYLSPYRPDPTFVVTPSLTFDRHGFFEAAPALQLSNGSTVVNASKFNEKKPITFAVSANTPLEFKQAIRDGILYWNRTDAGLDIRVVDAPVGISAPDIDYNIVQWVEWDVADSAYADAAVDPRTGEVLHAQAFIPSRFAVASGTLAANTVRRRRGGSSHPFCDLAAHETGSGVLGAPDVSATAVLRAAQDRVRAVAAHEVGHLLGLRHNFAGSARAKNYPIRDAKEIFQTYLHTDAVPDDLQVGSSVMDYYRLQEAALQGHRIRRTHLPALEHDAKALQALYQRRHFSRREIPLFCTDSDVDKYADCKKRDAGDSFLVFGAYVARDLVETMHYQLLETFANARAPHPGGRTQSVDTVAMQPESYAQAALTLASEALKTATSKGFLTVRRLYPVIDELNLAEVKFREASYLAAQVMAAGGGGNPSLNYLFQLPSPERLAEFSDEFAQTFEGSPQGRAWNFSSGEVRTMEARVREFYASFTDKLAGADLDMWLSVGSAWKDPTETQMGPLLLHLCRTKAEEYVLRAKPPSSGPTVEIDLAIGTGEDARRMTVTFLLRKFAYHAEVRAKAPLLLSAGTGAASRWGVAEKSQLRARFESRLREMFGDIEFASLREENIVAIRPATLDPVVRQLIQENRRVLEAF